MPVFTSPGSIAFSIFNIDVYFYGILMGLAVIIGLYVANKTVKYLYCTQQNEILDNAPLVLIGGIIGARVYYCILNNGYYFHHIKEFFNIRGGGLSIHGAMLGGAIVLWYLSKKLNISFPKLCDGFALAFPISQAIARWGNFFNSEAFGKPTNLPWGVYIQPENRPLKYADYSCFHPAFLYESILDLIIFGIMFYLIKNKKLFAGGYSALYLILYSSARIIVEYIRIDCSFFVLGIPFPIIVSLGIILFALWYLLKKRV